MSPEAGWYADPSDAASVRWWDGAAWSTETHPVPRELAMAGSAPAQVAASSGSASSTPAGSATPTLAPLAPTPAPSHSGTPQIVRPEITPQLSDRSRPGPRTMASTPPPPRAAAPAAADAPVYPQEAAAAPAPARPEVTPSAAAPWVDSSTAAHSTNQFGSPVNAAGRGVTGSAGFGAPVPSGHLTTSGSQRHVGRIIVVTVLMLALLAGVGVFAVPRYLAARDADLAASQPNVLSHAAPATLAGARRASSSDPRARAATSALSKLGATWAWSGTYGSRTATTLYVASDVPLAQRPDAVRALSSRSAGQQLMSTLVTTTVGPEGSVVMGTPTEYASPVGGKTWCMPVTASGIGGGFCTWTNGKEWLQVLSSPGLEQTAAKSTLAALAQLAQITTKHTAGS